MAELRRISAAAPPPPWEGGPGDRGEPVIYAGDSDQIASYVGKSTEEFMIAARTAVPELLDALDRARKLIVSWDREYEIRWPNRRGASDEEAANLYREHAEELRAALDGSEPT
jgi:hypothetical protein